jgi:uncharacterized membrane protein
MRAVTSRDDDLSWKGGLIYVNRDAAIMAGNRSGMAVYCLKWAVAARTGRRALR